jgi:hypothetical protein
MIRFINCVKRKPEMSTAEFRRYWDDPRFEALIRRMVELTGAARHARHATLDVAANEMVQDMRGGREPYDGVLEYWWESAGRLFQDLASPEGHALLLEMAGYQRQFVDFSQSTAFFTES